MDNQNDINQLQLMCHKLGREEFFRCVVQALYNASDDTSDFENKYLSEAYQNAAFTIQTLMDDGSI